MIRMCRGGSLWVPRHIERIYMSSLPKKSIDNNKYCLDYLKRCTSTIDVCKALNEFRDEELLSPDKIEALAHRHHCIFDSDLDSFVPSTNYYSFDFNNPLIFLNHFGGPRNVIKVYSKTRPVTPRVTNTDGSVTCPTCKREIYSPLWCDEQVRKFHVDYCLYCKQAFSEPGIVPGSWN